MATRLAFGQGAGTHPDSGPRGGDANTALAAYDVVSVKPVHPDRIIFMGVRALPDGIDGVNVTVALLVQSAYGESMDAPLDDSVAGLPDWAKSDRFAVQAKMNDAQVAVFSKLSKDEQEQRREAMLQALLEDRFKLKVHRETKQVPDYELVVAKGGPKFKEDGGTNPDAPKGPDGKPLARSFLAMQSGQVWAQAYSIEQFANSLEHMGSVDHMVKDKTGLTGKYTFTLTFAPSQRVGPEPASVPPQPSLSAPVAP